MRACCIATVVPILFFSSWTSASIAQTETTVVIGAIDLTQPRVAIVLQYAIPQYHDGSTYVVLERYQPPCDPNPPILSNSSEYRPTFGEGPCLHQIRARRYGGRVTIPRGALFNAVLTIPTWPVYTYPPAQGHPKNLLVRLGNETKFVARDTPYVEFKDVKGTRAPLEITVNAKLFSGNEPIPVKMPGFLPLIIER